MAGIQFYRDDRLPYFELKVCNTTELSYRHHTHEEFSLGIVDKGRSRFWYEGETAELSPGALVFLPPRLVHSCNPVEQDNWQYKMLFINSQWINGLMASRTEFFLNKPVIGYAKGRADFLLMNQMLENLMSKAAPLEKEASILQVFERFFRTEYEVYRLSARKEQPGLRIIREYIRQYFREKVTLDTLEQVSGLNKFHIIRLFKESFKVPPHTYQTLLRVNYAQKELRRQRPLAEIAIDAGFYDQSHFIKVFKSHTGVTPDKYQRQ